MIKPSAHPLWLVGFRPFFLLACLAGLSLPVLWVLIFLGALPAPRSPVSAVQWHAHEMFFGFGWAVLAGFLLTSTKNWVKVRGFHGWSLMFLAAAWLFERAGMAFGGQWPVAIFQVSSYVFLVSVVAMLLWTLVRHRHQDTFRDNVYFILILPLFLVAKTLLLNPDQFALGWSMTVGLFRMAFLVMLERTLTQFMQGVFKVAILRRGWLDHAIKTLGLAMIFEHLMPPWLAGAVGVTLAILLAVRFVFWKPQLAMQRLDIGIMYLGYLAIVAQLLVVAADAVLHAAWVGAFSVHLFAFGVMGLIIPAMLVRIAKGHTGRKAVFDDTDKRVLRLMILALVLRVAMPQIFPAVYAYWLSLAAACWFAGFATLAWRYIPYLLRPRVDGREH